MALAGLAVDKSAETWMVWTLKCRDVDGVDLADGQGRAHALLTVLFNPGPPPPLTVASPFCSVIAGRRRKGEAGLPVPPPTACPSSSQGSGEQGPARGSPLLPPLPGAKDSGGRVEVIRALTSVVGGFPIGTSPPITSARSGASDKPTVEKGQ